MEIEYRINAPITTDEFIELLESSALAERRPVHDRQCMEGMLSNSNLTVSAWKTGRLIGIARSVTDFHFACYLSDLAVSRDYQKCGIGKKLQAITKEQLGPDCFLILISAPAANSYYEHLGFTKVPACWALRPDQDMGF